MSFQKCAGIFGLVSLFTFSSYSASYVFDCKDVLERPNEFLVAKTLFGAIGAAHQQLQRREDQIAIENQKRPLAMGLWWTADSRIRSFERAFANNSSVWFNLKQIAQLNPAKTTYERFLTDGDLIVALKKYFASSVRDRASGKKKWTDDLYFSQIAREMARRQLTIERIAFSKSYQDFMALVDTDAFVREARFVHSDKSLATDLFSELLNANADRRVLETVLMPIAIKFREDGQNSFIYREFVENFFDILITKAEAGNFDILSLATISNMNVSHYQGSKFRLSSPSTLTGYDRLIEVIESRIKEYSESTEKAQKVHNLMRLLQDVRSVSGR